MKNLLTIIFAGFILIFSACKAPTKSPIIDSARLIKEVTRSETNLFSLSKEGKINEAFAMHDSSLAYKNIVDGVSRTHNQMDSIIKNFALKNVKGLEYNVSKRDFMIIDSSNVLETVEANRKLINITGNIVENKPAILSILWTNNNSKWIVSYLHSSYKK